MTGPSETDRPEATRILRDNSTRVGRPASIQNARADLILALSGVRVTEEEERVVAWLLDWDQPTLHALASVIRRAREAGPA